MDYSMWLSWDYGIVLVSAIFGIFTWLICLTKDLVIKVKSPKLVGAGITLMSGAIGGLGFVSFVSLGLYCVLVWVLEFWYYKLKSSRG